MTHRLNRPRDDSQRRGAIRTRPHLECLEDRYVPAMFSPLASAADGVADSLRAAIIAADANGQDDTITLQAGTYKLTAANTNGQENAAVEGDLDLTEANHTVTIQGAGTTSTVVDGGNLDRVFQVLGDVKVVFRDLTIQGGMASEDGTPGLPLVLPDAKGGGILNSGDTTLDHVLLQGCNAHGASGVSGLPLQAGTAGKNGGRRDLE